MKFKAGDLYEVIFWDHSVSFETAMKCAIVGYVVADGDISVKMTSWFPISIGMNQPYFEANCEISNIVKSTILKRRKFTSGR